MSSQFQKVSCTSAHPYQIPQDGIPSEQDPVVTILQKSAYPNQISFWSGAIRQHFQVVDSTQVQAKELVNVLPTDKWLILSAEEQTAGRGSHNRRWASPPHVNLYVTFLLPFPRSSSEKLFFISQVATIAVSRTVKKLGLNPEIKWPNDLMLNRKKASGILCENRTPDFSGNHSALLVGIGLNVNMEKSLCDSLDQPVTSLSVEANRSFEKEEILQELYHNLRECVDQLLLGGFSTFHDELNALLIYKGEPVVIDRDDGDSVQGIFLGIDEMGRLNLELADKQLITLSDGRLRKNPQVPSPKT